MITTLEQVALKDGAMMLIRMFEPPEADYARRLLDFLRHKDDGSYRGIRQRAMGQYAERCIDRYFVGEVEGAIIGHAWYGLPRPSASGTSAPTRGIGNFGHVYTKPVWRGQGVAREITRVLVGHFHDEPAGRCLLCSASEESGRIYQKFGFEFIPPTARSGAMGLIKPGVAASFAELDREYFAPGLQVRVREGHIGDRHDLDRMLDFSARWIEARQRWHLAAMASRVPTFIAALHYVEDGRGLLTVLENTAGSRLGYAFVLNLGSRHERGLRVMDFVVHPNYLDSAASLLKQTLAMARLREDGDVHAFVASCDEHKAAALRDAGFMEQYCFRGAFDLEGERHDLLLLRG